MRILNKAKAFLKEAKVASPGLDAEVLLAHLLGCERYELYTKDFCVDEKAYWELIKERAQGTPVAYLTKNKEFYGRDFTVGRGVLIPRPDSEALIEEALEVLRGPGRILDLCAGSGCLGITLALETESSVTLVDDDDGALCFLKINRDRLLPEAELIRSDLFDAVTGRYDLIISNPPYIDKKAYESLQTEVKCEPAHALIAGDGLKFYRKILSKVYDYLKPNGVLILEVGDKTQAGEIKRLVERYGSKGLSFLKSFCDLSGKTRGVVIKRQN